MRLVPLALLAVLAAGPALAQPDLSVSGYVEPGDETAAPGSNITLEYTVYNGGNVDVEEVNIGFYLSTDPVLDAGDDLFASEDLGSNVEAGESEDESEQVTLPFAAGGDYYVLIVVDYDDQVAESDESNNVAADGLTITGGGGGTPTNVDLTVSLTVDGTTVAADSGLDTSYEVANGGTAQAGASTVAVYLSTDPALSGDDVLVGSTDVDEVDAGDSTDGDLSVSIPSGTAAGDYYLVAAADANGVVSEDDEGNNTDAVAVSVTDGGGTGTSAVGEAGTFRRGLQTDGQFYNVDLLGTYADPVVVTGGLASGEPDSPATVRVAAVRPASFFVQVDEWDYLDGEQTGVEVPYLVFEAGVHTLADGRRVEAGVATTNANGVALVDFSAPFEGRPVLFTQVVTANNPGALTTRVRARSDRFRVDLATEEAQPGPSQRERVAWVAIAEGLGGAEGKPYETVVAGRVSDEPRIFRFFQTVTRDAVVLAAQQAISEADPATVRILRQGRIGVELQLQEEASADAETAHPGEVVGYAVFAPGLIEAQGDGDGNEDLTRTALADLEARPSGLTVAPNPTAGRATVGLDVAEAGPVRVEVFDALGRHVATLADGGLEAGPHAFAFEASRLPAGVYLVRASTAAGLEAVPVTVAR